MSVGRARRRPPAAGALFVVGGGTQWADALRVAAAYPAPARILDLGTIAIRDPAPVGTPYPGRHWPDQGARKLATLLNRLRAAWADTGVVVLGQDAGRLQRVTIASARRHGVAVAVVPDGALFDGEAALPTRERLEEIILTRCGVAAGRPLVFGSTAPDLWCAWGDGWVPMLTRYSPNGRVEVTGSPRGADFADVPPRDGPVERLLICSQPTWVHPFPPSTTAGSAWYAWLERIARSAPPGALSVRLHPRERDIVDTLGIGPATLAVITDGRSLADDLTGVDGLVAPFSTVLIEAAAAGRRVISVVPEAACATVREQSPAMSDAALAVFVSTDVGDYGDLCARTQRYGDVTQWGRRFAQLDPAAPTRCAESLVRATQTALSRR